MQSTQAWERVNDPEYGGRLGMEELERLLIRAGYSKEVAHKAGMQRGWDRLNAGETM